MNLPSKENKIKKILSLTNFSERKRYFTYKRTQIVQINKEINSKNQKIEGQKTKNKSLNILEKTSKKNYLNTNKNYESKLNKNNSLSQKNWKNINKVLKKISKKKKIKNTL